MITSSTTGGAPVAGPRSTAPKVTTNGPAIAGQAKIHREIGDRVEVSAAPKSERRWLYLAAAGLTLAGTVTGHLTNITPSATIAGLTGDSTLRKIEQLQQFGTFKNGGEVRDAGEVYRSFGALAQDSYGNNFRFYFSDEVYVSTSSERGLHSLYDFMFGEAGYGLTPDEIRMARELSNHPRFQTLADPHGAKFAAAASDGRYGNLRITMGGVYYHLHDIGDLKQLHGLFVGGTDMFSDRERELLILIAEETGGYSGNPFEILAHIDAGTPDRLDYGSPAYGWLNRRPTTREELMEYGQQLEGQLELDHYRPSPRRLRYQLGEPLTESRRLLGNSRAQMEALRGLGGVDPEILEQNLDRLGQALGELDALEARVARWDGSDDPNLIEDVAKIGERIVDLTSDFEKDPWNVFDDSRRRSLSQSIGDINRRVKQTQKESAPAGWAEPAANLEGYEP